MKLRQALFLDRDGVINEEVHYLWQPKDCRLVEGVVPLLLEAQRLGFFTVVVTTQAGIGRGMYTEEDFHALMRHIAAELHGYGARLDAVYFSPFHPEHGTGIYRRESECRKPGPGMLLQAAKEHNLDLAHSVMVGDRCTDIAAGAAAGVPHLVLFGKTEENGCDTKIPYIATNDMRDVMKVISRVAHTPPAETSCTTGSASFCI